MIFCIFFLRESFVDGILAAQESSDLRKANEKLQVGDAEMQQIWGATDQDHLGSIKMEDLMGFTYNII